MTEVLKLFLEISAMATVMILIVLVIRRLYSKKMSPAVMLVLWGMVLIRLIIPFTFNSPVSLTALLPDQSVAVEAQREVTTTDRIADSFPLAEHSLSTEKNNQPAKASMAQTATFSRLTEENKPAESKSSLSGLLNNIPLWSIFVSVWIAGMAATFCISIRKAARFRRKLRFCNATTNTEILKIIRSHKRKTGVRKTIKVLDCDFVSVPTVFGYFNPCLLIPTRFAKEMDLENLNAILLHEIYHICCHDILVKYFWLVTKSLHWFNPFVWLAYKRFDDDVEVRRDEKAARMLSKDGSLKYSESLLEAARFSNQITPVPTLTTTLFGNKHKLKQRVLRLIEPHRKTKSAALVSTFLAMLMIFVCFTTACQPTPETDAVVGRQEDILENVETVAPDDFEPVEVPDHISEVYDDYPYLSIEYDANVVVPETTSYPVTEVTKKDFSEEDIISYIDLFIDGDYEMYAGWTLTKDDYLNLLTKAKEYEGTERITQDSLNHLQELYDKTTNDVVNPQITSLSELPDGMSLNIKNRDNIVSSFGFEPGSNFFGYTRDESIAVYAASSDYTENMDGEYEYYQWLQPDEPDISQEDAYSIALEYKDTLGIDLDIYSAERCSFITDYVEKTTGWQFTFTRTISNLQVMDTSGAVVNPDAAPSYAAPWSEETLTISVDKNGLFSLYWRGASEISSTVVESAQLEDFDMIQQRITNQLNYLCGTWGEGRDAEFEIKITAIRLGISMLSIENEAEIGQYLPTWYVSYSYKFDDESDDEWELQQIMFSAIDGSYVEPRITNDDLMGNMDIGQDTPSDYSSE